MEPLHFVTILFLAGSLVMVVCCFVLFFQTRLAHLREWLISWLILFIAHVFFERMFVTEEPLYGVLFGFLIMLSPFFFLRGIHVLLERKNLSPWLVAIPLIGVVTSFVSLQTGPLLFYQSSVFFVSGSQYVLSGFLVIHQRDKIFTGTGCLFLVFGVLLALTPLMVRVDLYMPLGIFVLLTFGMLTAAGSIFLHFTTLQLAANKEKEKLEHLGYHDQLTGLANRARLLERTVFFSQKERYPVSVIFIDVNNLKEVNDTRGHHYGDALLKGVAAILDTLHREEDMHVRYGGDEFILLLPSTAEEEAMNLLAEIKRKCQTVEFDGITLAISAGHATQHTVKERFKEVFLRAEESMYKDKPDGNNT